MDYRAVSPAEREQMLASIGVSSMEDLFVDVAPRVAEAEALGWVGEPLEEQELVGVLSGLAAKNNPASGFVSFLGGGTYDHYTPSVVDFVLRRPEIFTAYTPYQPEVSQGTLQAIFEFQSVVSTLTGREVANAGMYDGATAFVEGALMAARVTKRVRILVSESIHPEWRQVLDTYATAGVLELEYAPTSELASRLDDTYGAVLVANPDFLGRIIDIRELVEAVHAVKALAVVAVNPVLQAVLETPGAHGADIVVGEGQSLGVPMSFGGPGIGIFACRQEHMRQLPGRIVGRAFDADGHPGFVLTLSTREQHIRRERATSNICSNQTLIATAVGVYAAAVGREGLRRVAELSVARAHHLRDELVATGMFEAIDDAPFGYEFALRYLGDVDRYFEVTREAGFLAGLRARDLSDAYDPNVIVFAVTEKVDRTSLDRFVSKVGELR